MDFIWIERLEAQERLPLPSIPVCQLFLSLLDNLVTILKSTRRNATCSRFARIKIWERKMQVKGGASRVSPIVLQLMRVSASFSMTSSSFESTLQYAVNILTRHNILAKATLSTRFFSKGSGKLFSFDEKLNCDCVFTFSQGRTLIKWLVLMIYRL